MRQEEKKPVIIIVGGKEYLLQVPCQSCKGGQFLTFNPTVPRTKTGKCNECRDGLVDTPLFTAIKTHMGIIDELPGTWRGKSVFTRPIPPNVPLANSIEGNLHFYPDDWRYGLQQNRGLCCQGPSRDSTSRSDGLLMGAANKQCRNCLRIKALKEKENVVYKD